MSQSFAIEFATLDHIVSRLRTTVETMGTSAVGAPTTVGAGAGSAATAAILEHLVRNAANVCAALEVSAAGVAESRADYNAVDQRSGTDMNRLGDRP